jgi:hypothetical protein
VSSQQKLRGQEGKEMIRREPVIVKGHFKDKRELIKIASDKIRRTFNVRGNIDIIKANDYDQEIDGHLCVGEFDSTSASSVKGLDP